jgi:hypothetical protein
MVRVEKWRWLTGGIRLVYGGAGTITKMKHEMRREIDRMTREESVDG